MPGGDGRRGAAQAIPLAAPSSTPSAAPLSAALAHHRYAWPRPDDPAGVWHPADTPGWLVRDLPETAAELRRDSRWPTFFPQPMCVVTTASGAGAERRTALEKVVGATIVNRFPYTLALSFCVADLSGRHHPRGAFLDTLLTSGRAAIQFLPPGDALDRVLKVIATTPEAETHTRIDRAGLPVSPGLDQDGDGADDGPPVFDDAHLVYEARLVAPGRDVFGHAIHPNPWVDVGSHKVVFLEIRVIQLDHAIATGRHRIRWRGLPRWTPRRPPFDARLPHEADPATQAARERALSGLDYRKGYRADYAFPAPGTVAFEADGVAGTRAFKRLPADPADQVEVDNDRARWPCFFPSPVGMITSRDADGRPNLMPCGSTTVVSRHPLVIAACVSYSPINARYAPRASLDIIRQTGRFGCGVAFDAPGILDAIAYLGNVSLRRDGDKLAHAGLDVVSAPGETPRVAQFPIHHDCRVIGEVTLGTHVMILGEVERVLIRDDLDPSAPLDWYPWADVEPAV